MGENVIGESAGEVFVLAVNLVMKDGALVRPRGEPTREVLGVHLRLTRPRARLVHMPPARVLNPAFAAAEAVWVLSGSDEPWIFDYNERLRAYADGGVLRGAYGPRLRRWGGTVDQLRRVVELMQEDPDTRRAVIQLYDPLQDAAGHRDVPCTLAYRFHLRGGRLHMATTMRSQDVWYGLPYDLFTATVVHELVAEWLCVNLDVYDHHVDSLHIYERDLGLAADLPAVPDPVEMTPLGLPWSDLDSVLADVVRGVPTGRAGWDALAAAMASYRSWKAGDRDTARRRAAAVESPLGTALDAWYDRLAAGEPVPVAVAASR
jgi:thymidylate synthase